MTRWARVGNSQKHKKLPEDATPWKDFWQNRNQNASDDASMNKVRSGRIEKKKLKQRKKFGFDEKRQHVENPENKNNSNFRNAEQEESESYHTLSKLSSSKETKEEYLSTEFQGLSKKQLRKAKKKAKQAKLQQLKNIESNDVAVNSTTSVADGSELSQTDDESPKEKKFPGRNIKNQEERNNSKFRSIKQEESESNHASTKFSSNKETNEEHLTTEFQGLSKKQLKKAKSQQLRNTESNDMPGNSSFNVADSTEMSQTDDKSPKEKDFQGRKKLFMQKLERKRKENGILLLPAKVERKLYIIKKRLREKGLPPAAIKDIARKERRKEELKFRRSMSSKPCFNCRQIGHLLAECPMKLGNSNQETGLCFKCGSAEHTSYKCPEKIEGYPLAKCFVCKEQGHISKDCPKNEHGVYIKGGKCSLCGNVNHLKKDCPTLKKKYDEEPDITAYTINAEKSVDAEIIPTDDVTSDVKTYMKKGKKAKLVKF